MKIVRQCVERMPAGDYRTQDRKVTPPPRARIDESMEALIHHFKLFTEGFKVPPGETYAAVESPRGEIGCYLVSDGTGKPVRMHIRGPSFYNLQSHRADGGRHARRRHGRDHLHRRSHHGGGGPLVPTPVTISTSEARSGLTDARPAARQGDHRPVPAREVGAAPVAAPRAGSERLGHAGGDGRDRGDARSHARARPRDLFLLHDVQARAGRRARRVGVHERVVPRERRTGSARGPSRTASPTTATCSSRRSSASRPATWPRCCR